jgi:hypothetical protein
MLNAQLPCYNVEWRDHKCEDAQCHLISYSLRIMAAREHLLQTPWPPLPALGAKLH